MDGKFPLALDLRCANLLSPDAAVPVNFPQLEWPDGVWMEPLAEQLGPYLQAHANLEPQRLLVCQVVQVLWLQMQPSLGEDWALPCYSS